MKRTVIICLFFLTPLIILGFLDWKIKQQFSGVKPTPQGILPDVSGVPNPDITQANMNQTICNPNWSTKLIRPSTSYTNPIKVKALARYNKEFGTNYKMADGELDHLISIELAGSPTDPNNLWFEPYTTTPNARNKDLVENYLHTAICNGTITLATAQKEISTDWVSIYRNMTKKFGGIVGITDQDDE